MPSNVPSSSSTQQRGKGSYEMLYFVFTKDVYVQLVFAQLALALAIISGGIGLLHAEGAAQRSFFFRMWEALGVAQVVVLSQLALALGVVSGGYGILSTAKLIW